ncbi:FISUMP domain-containing protein [uncultured Alistipes sp.]|jgi:putative lipoprotein|uniref:FISUMP domain-containing protein n=1 Tax=uncultured Alistipes sp. TaxID=538949 RepID=UPI0025CF2F8D|nr:FISUMP domain-containing protein [uncultured Alistipes sp.]
MKKIVMMMTALALLAGCSDSDGGGKGSDDKLVYGGVTYKTVTLKDGNVWMAENLRYVPAGKTVSGDPTASAGIWYPYSSDGTTVTALTDAESVAKYGYLYDVETALGGVTLTEANHKSFEGVQGICPDGWHIPTLDECMEIACLASKFTAWEETDARVNTDSPYYDSDYNATRITSLDNDGFNFTFAGVRMQATPSATGSYVKNVYDDHLSLSYVHGSAGYQYAASTGNIQMLAMMTTYNATYPDGRLSVAFLGHKYGAAVRCVKDKK